MGDQSYTAISVYTEEENVLLSYKIEATLRDFVRRRILLF